jgi:transcriptional regulator with XRE-family HTH domain
LQTAGGTPNLLRDMAVTRERVAEQLLALRQLHGTADKPLSQEKAAQRADVQVRDWNRWENKHTTPHISSLGKVAEAFDIPLDVFDDGREDRSSTPLSDRLDRLESELQTTRALLTAVAQHLQVDPALLEAHAAAADAEAIAAQRPAAGSAASPTGSSRASRPRARSGS